MKERGQKRRFLDQTFEKHTTKLCSKFFASNFEPLQQLTEGQTIVLMAGLLACYKGHL